MIFAYFEDWAGGDMASYWRTALVVALTLGVAVGCSPGARFPNDAELVDMLRAEFGERERLGYRCDVYYDINGITIEDKHVEKDSATVEIVLSVTARKQMHSLFLMSSCYYRDAWEDGQRRNIRMTVQLEKWESGWRKVPE